MTLPEPVVLILISTIGGIVGGVIAAIARPWGQDYVNRKADERARATRLEDEDRTEQRRQAEAAERRAEATERREAERRAERTQRLRELQEALAGVAGSSHTSASEGRYQASRATAAAIGDPALSESIGRMFASHGIGYADWNDALGDAVHRIGELEAELRSED
jgi:Tfp pilus assembly protein PilE